MRYLISVMPLFLTLMVCVVGVYSMTSYCICVKRPLRLLAIMTAVCFACNAVLFLLLGRDRYESIMILTVAVPYFILLLWMTRGNTAKTFFNFWLWVTIYAMISNLSLFVDDIAFHSILGKNILRISLVLLYLIVYHRYLRAHHHRILEISNVNWWVFSLVPMFFEVLIVISHKTGRIPEGFSRNYLLLFIILLLMLLVYGMILYTFQKAKAQSQAELAKIRYFQELESARSRMEFLDEAQIKTAIHRHNMRHNLIVIDGLLDTGKVQQARDYIREIQNGIEALSLKYYCENNLANMLCSYFYDRAARSEVELRIDAEIPHQIPISDVELCAILSNGLENALHAVMRLEPASRWIQLRCSTRQENLLIEIKNPCTGEVKFQNGIPSSNREGHGYGCQSIRSIAQQHQGLCLFETENGIFIMRVILPLHS